MVKTRLINGRKSHSSSGSAGSSVIGDDLAIAETTDGSASPTAGSLEGSSAPLPVVHHHDGR